MSLKKMELELGIKRAEAAKFELMYKIEKNKEEIKRLEDHIILQNKVIDDLTNELKIME